MYPLSSPINCKDLFALKALLFLGTCKNIFIYDWNSLKWSLKTHFLKEILLIRRSHRFECFPSNQSNKIQICWKDIQAYRRRFDFNNLYKYSACLVHWWKTYFIYRFDYWKQKTICSVHILYFLKKTKKLQRWLLW